VRWNLIEIMKFNDYDLDFLAKSIPEYLHIYRHDNDMKTILNEVKIQIKERSDKRFKKGMLYAGITAALVGAVIAYRSLRK